jgi:hypothetical protein
MFEIHVILALQKCSLYRICSAKSVSQLNFPRLFMSRFLIFLDILVLGEFECQMLVQNFNAKCFRKFQFILSMYNVWLRFFSQSFGYMYGSVFSFQFTFNLSFAVTLMDKGITMKECIL